MPKRKIRKDSPETLAAMRAVRGHGRELTAEEEQAHADFVRRSAIKRLDSGTSVTTRRKQDVFRKAEGEGGADYDELPSAFALKQQERDYLTDVAKRFRRPPTAKAIQSRQQTSKQLQYKILSLLERYRPLGRGAAKAVADELGLTPEYVRRVRAAHAKQT